VQPVACASVPRKGAPRCASGLPDRADGREGRTASPESGPPASVENCCFTAAGGAEPVLRDGGRACHYRDRGDRLSFGSGRKLRPPPPERRQGGACRLLSERDVMTSRVSLVETTALQMGRQLRRTSRDGPAVVPTRGGGVRGTFSALGLCHSGTPRTPGPAAESAAQEVDAPRLQDATSGGGATRGTERWRTSRRNRASIVLCRKSEKGFGGAAGPHYTHTGSRRGPYPEVMGRRKAEE